MIPEREREALMRLTMCARGECPMCKYEEQCDNWDFRMELATKNMNILADALRVADTPQTELWDKKASDCDLWQKDRTCIGCHRYDICKQADTPQTDKDKVVCPNCGRSDYIRSFEKDFGIKSDFKYKCINCNTYIKDAPQTERKYYENNATPLWIW